jgi:hypothetical protein
MARTHEVQKWVASFVILVLAGAALLLFGWRTRKPIVLQGAVTVQDADTRKERPIADVEVSADGGLAIHAVRSDASGFFKIELPKTVRRGQPVTLQFRHPEYRSLDLHDYVGDKLYVAQMVPLSTSTKPPPNQTQIRVANVRVRYSIKALTEINVGSAVQTFQVENKGNVPCKGQHPCSPDGKWKAALASASLDAGPGNELRQARASCIAGPCPFTKIESDHLPQGEQLIRVTARNWSDTATFLLEAEVFHPMVSDIIHESYPVIFGEGLNFTLPSAAEGVNIQADIDGQTVIFPLGPSLFLSWASCNARVNPDQTRVYRCALKPGYRFQ